MDTTEQTVVLAPAKVVAALCGIVLVMYGLSGVAFGGAEFPIAFPDGSVGGDDRRPDVFGVVAANSGTVASWAIAALVLLLGAYWPSAADARAGRRSPVS